MSTPVTAPPLGKAAGLFVSCAVVLCGVWRGISPMTLLGRVVIAAMVTSLLVGGLVRSFSYNSPSDDD